MHVKQVRYERRFNVGNFEYATLEVVTEVGEGESAERAILEAKNLVRKHAPTKQIGSKAEEEKPS